MSDSRHGINGGSDRESLIEAVKILGPTMGKKLVRSPTNASFNMEELGANDDRISDAISAVVSSQC
jgi:hypothetical protein